MTPRKRQAPIWISKSAALAIHERLLVEHGGASGFVGEHLLDAALASPVNHHLHGESDLFELAGVYAFALTQDHPFVDGNKRVALTIAATFLEINGVRLVAPEAEAVRMILDLSSGHARAEHFAEWARQHSVTLAPGTGARSLRIRRKKK